MGTGRRRFPHRSHRVLGHAPLLTPIDSESGAEVDRAVFTQEMPQSALAPLAAESLRSASRISGVMGLTAAAARNCANRASLTNFRRSFMAPVDQAGPGAVAATAFSNEQPRAYQGAVLL